jgi:lipopolysaccharide export system permease protein
VVSETGRHRRESPSGDHLVTLAKGHRFDGKPGEGHYLIGSFAEYRLRIRGKGNEGQAIAKRSTAPSLQLLDSPDLADRSELEHRLSAPLAVLVLTAVAVPRVSVSPRQRTSGRLTLAFLAYFSFFNLQRLAESWLATGTSPPWLTSLWYQALILGLVYLALVPDSLWLKRQRERLRGPTRASRQPPDGRLPPGP